MCGIAGFYIKNPKSSKIPPQDVIEEFVNQLLLGIVSRGHDATGVFSVSSENPKIGRIEKEDAPATMFIHWRNPVLEQPRYVMTHTRLATKGHQSKNENNHPVQYETVFVTHNGVIVNDDSLFRVHDLKRFAEVDTEIIPALLSKFGFENIGEALSKLNGGFAIAATDPKNNPGEVYLAKGPRNPIEVFETKSVVVWASTRSVIHDAWKEVFGAAPATKQFKSLHDGDILLLSPGEHESKPMKFEVYKTYSSNNGYSPDSWMSNPTYLEKQKFCVCGHKREKHTGSKFDGGCFNHQDGKSCTCKSFIESGIQSRRQQEYEATQEQTDTSEVSKLITTPKHVQDGHSSRTLTIRRNGVTIEWVTCYECRAMFDKKEMVIDLKSRYYVCNMCALLTNDHNTLPPSFDPPAEQGKMPSADTPVTEDLNDDGDEDEKPAWSELEAEIALRLGLQPQHVHHVLVDAGVDELNASESLINEYCLLEDTKHEILRDWQGLMEPPDKGSWSGKSLEIYQSGNPEASEAETAEILRGTEDYGSCGVSVFETETERRLH